MDAVKDPDASDDVSVTWTLEEGETIGSVTWLVAGPDEELEASDATNDETTATVRLSGGTPGSDYELTCRVTTSTVRTPNDKTLVIGVRET